MTLFANRRIHAGKGERHVTWLELFFDLVAVVAVSRLGIQLHSDHSLAGILAFTGLLLSVQALVTCALLALSLLALITTEAVWTRRATP